MQILQNKKIIIFFVLCCIGVLGYFTFFKTSPQAEQGSQSDKLVGQDILDLVQSLQKVSIEPTLFSGAFFKNLRDFTTAIVPEEQGRNNPFASLRTETNTSKTKTQQSTVPKKAGN